MEILELFKDHPEYENYEPGETIFRENSLGDTMYVVKEGEVDILLEDKVLETAKPGSFFGEMALIDNDGRSATVRAKTQCSLIPIDRDRFKQLILQDPEFALDVMEVMAKRVRNMNEWWSARWGGR